ncbi:unnamed protein product [Schistosoma curassoni]|uniref:ATP synthase F0 subunit 8 n=1 Tax=Schistosoma curassoni TaxID=6186 RepID=A0A183L370_9TREM|nr:unnamed protein product [Schistosoma curassoni]
MHQYVYIHMVFLLSTIWLAFVYLQISVESQQPKH